MSSIKDKITPGECYATGHHIRVKGKTGAIGQSFVANVPGPHNNFADDVEGKSNAILWARSKDMLDILERLAASDFKNEEDAATEYWELNLIAINLLKELNDEG